MTRRPRKHKPSAAPKRVSEAPVETTVFRSGNSDAVRLPTRLGLLGARVVVRPLGEGRLLIEPKAMRGWPRGFFTSFGRVSPDLDAPARARPDRRADDSAARIFDEG